MGCHALLQGIFPTWRLNPAWSSALLADSLPSEPPGKPSDNSEAKLKVLLTSIWTVSRKECLITDLIERGHLENDPPWERTSSCGLWKAVSCIAHTIPGVFSEKKWGGRTFFLLEGIVWFPDNVFNFILVLLSFSLPHGIPIPNQDTLPQVDCYPHLINLTSISLPPSFAFFFNRMMFWNLFTFGCTGSSFLHRLSLAVESGGYSLVAGCRLLLVVASLAEA